MYKGIPVVMNDDDIIRAEGGGLLYFNGTAVRNLRCKVDYLLTNYILIPRNI